ncbi:MAG: ATP-binding protein [Calditrichia bacterium]
MTISLQRFSLKTKLWLFATLVFACISLLVAGWLYQSHKDLSSDFERKARSVTTTTTLNLGAAIWFYQHDFISKTMQPLENDLDTDFLQIIDVDGKSVYSYREAMAGEVLGVFKRSALTEEHSEDHFLLKQPVFYNEALQGYLICGYSKQWISSRFNILLKTALTSLAILFGMLSLLTFLFGKALTRPLIKAARLLNEEDAESDRFHLRFSESQGAELAVLGGAINRLGESYDAKLKTFRHYDDYLGSFFKLSPIPILITNPHGVVEKSNETAAMFFEKPLSKIEESNLSDLIGGNDFIVIKNHIDKSGDDISGYITSINTGGEVGKIVELNLSLLRDHKNVIKNYILFFVDVTEKIQTQHEILENQNLLSTVNRELTTRTDELQSISVRNKRNAQKLGRLIEICYEIVSCNSTEEILAVLVDSGSDLLEAEECIAYIWNPLEKQLHPQRSFTANGLENLQIITESDGVIWRTFHENQSFFLTESSLTSVDFSELAIENLAAQVLIAVPLSNQESQYGVAIYRHSERSMFAIEDLHLLSALASHAAITMNKLFLLRELQEKALHLEKMNRDLQGSQKQIVQLQKMESLGTLVGGIAHDFNNILGIILPNIDLLQLNNESDPETNKRASIIQEAAQRAAKLTQQLLVFSRNQEIEREPLQLNQLIRQSVAMLRRTLGKHVDIKMDLDALLPNVLADENRLIQVVMNLSVNARDAMPDGGELRFETRFGRYTLMANNHEPANFVRMSVRDSGSGIATEVLDKIFDPFFTTKSVGKGTGLGLSVVYGIVSGHDGYITVESDEASGTVFHLYFPPTEQEVIIKNGATVSSFPIGSEKILVVDDEELIRISLKDTLESLGYSVNVAESGAAAIGLLNTDEAIQLAIVDFAMPQMNGLDTIKELRKLRPELKVLLSSGYTSGEELSQEHQYIDDFLPKPYRVNELAVMLRTLLNNPDRGQKNAAIHG